MSKLKHLEIGINQPILNSCFDLKYKSANVSETSSLT